VPLRAASNLPAMRFSQTLVQGRTAAATQSPVACVRWLGHAYRKVLLRRLGCNREMAAASHPSAGATRVEFCELHTCTTRAAGSGCLNCHGTEPVPLVTIQVGLYTCSTPSLRTWGCGAVRGLLALASKG
jgi:hypothetical protein